MSNYEAFDRLSGVLNDIGKYKEQMRQRKIDEQATSLLLQGDSAGAEQYLVEQMAPEKKGIAGFAQRLFGGGAAPELTPMQQQVIAKQMQGGLATPQQTADLNATTADTAATTNADRRAEELHPLQKEQAENAPQMQALGDLSRVLSSYLRENSVGQYDKNIDSISDSLSSIVGKISGKQKTAKDQGSSRPTIQGSSLTPDQGSSLTPIQGGAQRNPKMYSNLKTGELYVNGKGTGAVASNSATQTVQGGPNTDVNWARNFQKNAIARIGEKGGNDKDVMDFQNIMSSGDFDSILQMFQQLWQ